MNDAPIAFGDIYQTKGTIRLMTQPAPTITASADNGNFQFIYEPELANVNDPPSSCEWTKERPGMTVVGTFAPDVMAAPGYRKAGDGPRQKAVGSVRITVQEAGILQGFPPDWIWPRTKGKGFLAAGNAVCPPVQKAMCEELLRSAA